jgi:pSer/pThr/pTyr-binding forkhead associated (FHA) protein
MLGPGAKTAIEQMFANRTDTLDTWAKLQQECLMVHRDQLDAVSRAQPVSGLSWRLRKTAPPAAESQPEPTQPQVSPQPTVTTRAARAPITSQNPAPPARDPAPQVRDVTPEVPDLVPQALVDRGTFGLNFVDTERRVRLPLEGEVVLGRFERGFSNPPDVDLTFEDGLNDSVSRRHARIVVEHGQHWLEDLGSANGTYLNGYQLALGERVQLQAGARIMLGYCRAEYNEQPVWTCEPDPTQPHLPILSITTTSQPIELPDLETILLGRSDPSIGYVSDVDLSVAGDVADQVSRRHARVIALDGRHYLEAAGSAAEVRLNGKPIDVGDPPVLLYPGDQIWLGGCVVAYEWRLLEENETRAHTFPQSLLNRLNHQSSTVDLPRNSA